MRSLFPFLVLALITLAACADPEPSTPPAGDEPSEDPADEGFALTAPAEGEDSDLPLADPSDEPDGTFGALAEDDARYVFGDDDRRVIPNTSVSPYSSVVLVVGTFKTGTPATCSGTLIGPDVVLTAAHCVHDDLNGGGRAVSLSVAPGAYVNKLGQQQAQSWGKTYGVGVYYPKEYRDPHGYGGDLEEYDYAVIRLQKPLGDVAGYLRYGTLANPTGKRIRSAAYRRHACNPRVPQCKNPVKGMEMYEVQGRVSGLRRDKLFDSYMDGVGGSSGAGITSPDHDDNMVFAVDISESDPAVDLPYNSSLLLTPPIVANIKRWATVATKK